MAKQDGWKPHEAQPESLFPVPSRLGAHYGGLQEFMGPFGPAGPRRKAETAVAPFQRPGGAKKILNLGGMILQDRPWEQSMSFSLLPVGSVFVLPE